MVEFYYRLRPFILLFFLLTASVLVMVNANRPLMWGIRAEVLRIVGSIEYRLSWTSEILLALRENQDLRSSNLQLTSELARLRIAELENNELRRALGWQTDIELEVLAARIIAREPFGATNFLTLNVGRAQGVDLDMAVISHLGIIGRIVHVSDNYSEVMPYLHSQFHIPVMIDSLQSVGIVSGKDSTPDSLVLHNIVRTENVRIGQHVITHEASEIFPPNIPVGTVGGVHIQPGNNFLIVKLTPAVPLQTTHFAFVVLNQRPPHLEHDAASPLLN